MGQAPSLSDFPQVKQSSLHTSSTLLLINRKRKSCLNARGREFAFPPFPGLCLKYKCMSDTELPRVQVAGSDPWLPHPVTGHHSTCCDSAFRTQLPGKHSTPSPLLSIGPCFFQHVTTEGRSEGTGGLTGISKAGPGNATAGLD